MSRKKLSQPTMTQKYLKSVLHYDPETGIFTWLVNKNGPTIKGARAGSRYKHQDKRRIIVDRKEYKEHRLAWFYMTGEWIERIDHRDLNGLNNAWSNLRAATHSQNMANTRQRCASGVKGVRYVERLQKWLAQIGFEKKNHHLGTFATKEEAAEAYKAKAIEVFGEFARW